MGQRVDSASNDVKSVVGPLGGEPLDVVFCGGCGQEKEGDTPAQGYAPVDYAEENWVSVDGGLYCSAYCGAKAAGLTEAEAQLARAHVTQTQMRREGLEAEADADAEFIREIVENPEAHPYAPQLEHVADDSDHPHEFGVEGGPFGDPDEEFEALMRELSSPEGSDS